jgi:2-polyprenyl-3-methyl-5-hydroxy-6-metoxy-1,4-benzoquinol methylase
MKVCIFEFCPACGVLDSEVIFRPSAQSWQRFINLSRIKYQGFMDGWEKKLSLEIHKCNRCSHIWHHTQPDQEALFGMYDSSIPLRPVIKTTEPSYYMLRQMRALFQTVSYVGKTKSTLLDFGSGAGRWSRAATAAGFIVTAYEPSTKRSVDACGSNIFRVINHLDDIKNEHFDALIMEQVLEHTQEPIEMLKALRDYCHSHTILRISVPNTALLTTKKDIWDDFPFNGKKIHIMSPFEHLQGFSPMSFTTVLEKAGLEILGLRQLIATHPVYVLRKIIGRFIPYLQQTLAISRFSKTI